MKPTFFLLLGALLFFSCKKDSYTNLSATLSPDSSFITAYEGDPLVINLSFDKKLSEPIEIVGKIHNDHTNFINQEDYRPFLEYSTTLGKTWHKGKGGYNFIVPKKTDYLKLRIATLDDKDVEVNEFFDLELNKASGQNNLDVFNDPLHFEMKVIDNEKEISRTLDNSSLIMAFDLNETDYTIDAATDELEYGELKFIFDEKKYEEFIEKSVVPVNNHFDNAHDVKRFEMFSSQNLYGYMYNTGSVKENQWAMGLNVFIAYLKVQRDESGGFNIQRQPYNFDGEASYTLVHEAGHILSLTLGIHIDNTLEVDDCGFTDEYNDCFRKDSWMTTFYNRFYNPETKEAVVSPEFVTDYAGYNMGEDVAETITVFTILEAEGRLPKLDENSSTAIKKLHFIGAQAEVPPFAKALYPTGPKINVPLYQKATQSKANYLYDTPLKNRYKGKVVSCLEVPDLLKKEKQPLLTLITKYCSSFVAVFGI